MINIEFLENTWFFETITFKEWELLFNEWDIDNNLYIIKSWDLSIEKFASTDRLETKKLAIVSDGWIIWEWSLSNSDPKEVRISAKTEAVVLKIDAKEWFEKFLVKHTREWVNLLSTIINIWNKRLLESNFLVTSSYKISKEIAETTEFNNKNLFRIVDIFSKAIGWKYVIYIEKNPIIKEYVNVKYDSRNEWRMQSTVIELTQNWLELEKLELEWIELWKYNLVEELKNGNENIGYLVIWENDKSFNEWQKKSITSISTLIAWFIKQKQYFEDNKNLEYSKFD